MSGATEEIVSVVETAVARAEESAAAAQATIETLTEAAIRDKLSSRIDDCDEGIDECQTLAEENANEIQNLETVVRMQAGEITTLRTEMAAFQATLEATVLSFLTQQNMRAQPSPLDQPKPGEKPGPSEQIPSIPKPEGEKEEGPPAPENGPPRRRGRLI